MPLEELSEEQYKQLLDGFNRGEFLSKLEINLGISASVIVEKMHSLSLQDPDTWNPEKAQGYRMEYVRLFAPHLHREGRNERRTRQQKHTTVGNERESKIQYFMTLISNIPDVGYKIGPPEIADGRLKIPLLDAEVMSYAVEDFRNTITNYLSKKLRSIVLRFNYEGNYILIYPSNVGINLVNGFLFLEAYKRVLEKSLKIEA